MNVLEHYIKRIISEEPVTINNEEYVCVHCIVDCWGCVEEVEHVASRAEWEQEKAQGYYLG